jgi:hypothetical protein
VSWIGNGCTKSSGRISFERIIIRKRNAIRATEYEKRSRKSSIKTRATGPENVRLITFYKNTRSGSRNRIKSI